MSSFLAAHEASLRFAFFAGTFSACAAFESFFPAMHRIHHSQRRDETDSNYGFDLSLWDRLFRTYRSVASVPRFPLGLPGDEGQGSANPWTALLLPFRKATSR